MSTMAGIEYVGDLGPAPSTASLRNLDLLFIGTASSDRYHLAGKALRGGVHLFLEWPPATSIIECAELMRVAEEAGLECGVSRPLRFSPLLDPVHDGWRADVISLTLSGDSLPTNNGGAVRPAAQALLADGVDLACFLAGTSSVRRVDAAAASRNLARRDATLFSLRFHSGAYVQGLIRLDGPADPITIYASGQDFCIEGPLDAAEDVLRRETTAFLTAIAGGRPGPVSAFDALQTMRIVERLQALLR